MGVINGKSFPFLIQGLTLYDCLMIADESFKAKDFTSAWLWSRYAWTATTHPEMKAYVSRLMAAVSKEVDRTSCNNSGLITHTYTPSVHVAYTRCDYIANVSLVLRNDWYVMKTPGICNDTEMPSEAWWHLERRDRPFPCSSFRRPESGAARHHLRSALSRGAFHGKAESLSDALINTDYFLATLFSLLAFRNIHTDFFLFRSVLTSNSHL